MLPLLVTCMIRCCCVGLPNRTALSMDPATGALSGVPSNADLEASPLHLVVRADDRRGGIVFASFDLVPLALAARLSQLCEQVIAKQAKVPVAFDIPPQTANQGVPFVFSAAGYFTSEDALQFVVAGLPDNSGLIMGFDSGPATPPATMTFDAGVYCFCFAYEHTSLPNTGILAGTPSIADITSRNVGPRELTVFTTTHDSFPISKQ